MNYKKQNKDIINCKLGKACMPGVVSSGYAFIVLSVFPVLTFELSGYIGGAVFFLVGHFLAFTSCGVDLDVEEKRMNYYKVFFFFIKTHKWIDLSKFDYITVLISNVKTVIYSRSNRSTSQDEKKYEVYLMDSSKTDKQIVASFLRVKDATTFAKNIARKLNKKYVLSD